MDNFLKYRKENVSLLLITSINEIFVKSSFKKIFHIQRKNIPHLKDETVQRLRIENIFFIFWEIFGLL